MIVSSFSEILSIGAVVPFLAVLSTPDKVFNYPIVNSWMHVLNLHTGQDLLLPLTISFCLAAVLSGVLRLILLWSTSRLSFAVGADLGMAIYKRTLYQPYSIHISRNSGQIISGIFSKTEMVIGQVINPVLTALSSVVILITILVALLILDPVIALVAIGGFGVVYAIIIGFTRKRIAKNSIKIAQESTQVIKCLQEGLGGIRDVIIDGNQETYCEIYGEADNLLRKAQGSNLFMSIGPRYGVEALGMVLIASFAYVLSSNQQNSFNVIAVLGAFALGAQRLLPVLQQMYHSWSTIRGAQASLFDTLSLLEQPLPLMVGDESLKKISFSREIRFNNVSFRYAESTPWVIKKLNFTIKRGSRVGIIGTTGHGKSTLLDILMGLLIPEDGELLVDDVPITEETRRSWQLRIAHVPQSIYLADSSILENIALGVSPQKIDFERVQSAAKQAQISKVIESMDEGYLTGVGERGVRLSGGQCQRIGIARALYKRADVIILDEATSALDSETERSVMKAIDGLSSKMTVVIVAHRLSTLNACDLILELGDKGIRDCTESYLHPNK
jgi:ATP-binding cassette subfamily B protein